MFTPNTSTPMEHLEDETSVSEPIDLGSEPCDLLAPVMVGIFALELAQMALGLNAAATTPLPGAGGPDG